MNENEIIKGKLSFFFKAGKPVYFKLTDDNFRNGIIIKLLNEYVILKDVVLGEVPIYFDEIKSSTISESKSHRLNKEVEDGSQ